ncbi:MAG: hypothetical protein IMZ61_14065 [Planctomycetes bacterium]|nr:hypothetical protein [Planctomycetota bacterium]
MTYATEYKWIDEYEETGRNQHGTRYKKKYSSKRVKVVTMSTTFDDEHDLARLVYLSDKLSAPIRWDSLSNPQKAYIKLVSAEVI